MQLGIKDAARLLKSRGETIYREIEEGKLPVCRNIQRAVPLQPGGAPGVGTSRKMKVSPDIYRENAGASQAALLPCLTPSPPGRPRSPRGGKQGRGPPGLVKLMRLPEGASRNFLLDVLLAREAFGLDGIGEGVAIPHARNPIVLQVPKPMVTLLLPAPPWISPPCDGGPVHGYSPSWSRASDHLHLLSRLAFVLERTALQASAGEARRGPGKRSWPKSAASRIPCRAKERLLRWRILLSLRRRSLGRTPCAGTPQKLPPGAILSRRRGRPRRRWASPGAEGRLAAGRLRSAYPWSLPHRRVLRGPGASSAFSCRDPGNPARLPAVYGAEYRRGTQRRGRAARRGFLMQTPRASMAGVDDRPGRRCSFLMLLEVMCVSSP